MQSIATEIYAASALRAILAGVDRNNLQPVLTCGHRKALNRVIADAYTHTTLSMLHHVVELDDSHLDSVDDDTILTLVVRAAHGFASGVALCRAVEHAIAMQALHLCYVGSDAALADRYSSLHTEAVAAALALLRSGGTLPRITPHWT